MKTINFSKIVTTPKTCIRVQDRSEGFELETYMEAIGMWKMRRDKETDEPDVVSGNGLTVYIPSEPNNEPGLRNGVDTYFVDKEGYIVYEYKNVIKDISPYRNIPISHNFLSYGILIVLRNGDRYQTVETPDNEVLLYNIESYTLDDYNEDLTHKTSPALDIVAMIRPKLVADIGLSSLLNSYDGVDGVIWDRWDDHLNIPIDTNSIPSLPKYVTTETITGTTTTTVNGEKDMNLLEKIVAWFKNLFK